MLRHNGFNMLRFTGCLLIRHFSVSNPLPKSTVRYPSSSKNEIISVSTQRKVSPGAENLIVTVSNLGWEDINLFYAILELFVLLLWF